MAPTRWLWADAEVVRVVDGDTVIARLTRDVGFHGTVTFEQRLRLARINAPAGKTEAGKAARAALTALTTGLVTIETIKPYKYGDAFIAEITTTDGVNVSDVLVERGLAVSWSGSGARPADG